MRRKDAVRQTLGYPPLESGVYPQVSAEALLDHFAIVKSIPDKKARRVVVEASAPADEPVGGAQAIAEIRRP